MILDTVRRVGPSLSRRLGRNTSSGYSVVDRESVASSMPDGWKNRQAARRQDLAYQSLLAEMYAGSPRQDLLAAAKAVELTGIEAPEILEVGCGSGYYSEIIPHLLGRPVGYIGLDSSPAMIQLAHSRYTDRLFLLGDASRVPLEDRALDIIFNGAALMHTPEFEMAILEASRVSRGWCVFHTVPVRLDGDTTFLVKRAYGKKTIEVIFNRAALLESFSRCGLSVCAVMESVPYDLEHILGEPTLSLTYLCRLSHP